MTFSINRLAAVAAGSFLLTACGGSDEPAADTETEAAATETTAAEASAGSDTAAAETQTAATSEPEMLEAPEGSLADSEMALGSPDAPVTIVEYASVTCPGCAAFHAQLFPRIKEEFIDTGKVRFVYREFPTPPQRYAVAGFIVARCAATEAGSEGYFAMVDALYKTQRQWIYGDDRAEALQNIAAQAGIDQEGFNDCFRRQDIRDAIVENVESGQQAGVSRTPTLLIDGQEFDYGNSVDEAVQRLNAEVEKRS